MPNKILLGALLCFLLNAVLLNGAVAATLTWDTFPPPWGDASLKKNCDLIKFNMEYCPHCVALQTAIRDDGMCTSGKYDLRCRFPYAEDLSDKDLQFWNVAAGGLPFTVLYKRVSGNTWKEVGHWRGNYFNQIKAAVAANCPNAAAPTPTPYPPAVR